jgi:hypothetical protein
MFDPGSFTMLGDPPDRIKHEERAHVKALAIPAAGKDFPKKIRWQRRPCFVT